MNEFCGWCGEVLDADSTRFCASCGHAVARRGSATQGGSDDTVLSSRPRSVPDASPNGIDRYEIRAVLGQGRAGTVFRAFDPALGRLVALRQLSPEVVDDPSRLEQVRSAVSRMAGLSDEHCVEVYDLNDKVTPPVVVAEYVDGQSVASLTDHQGTLDPKAALVVMDGALSGLERIHSIRLVHGYLTPSCVLLDESGRSKIADVGIGYGSVIPAQAARYLAPDVRSGATPGVAADVWGATALFALLMTGGPPGTRSLDSLPEPLAAIVRTGLAVNPELRPRGITELRAMFTRAAVSSYGDGWREAGTASMASIMGVTAAALVVPDAVSAATALYAAAKTAAAQALAGNATVAAGSCGAGAGGVYSGAGVAGASYGTAGGAAWGGAVAGSAGLFAKSIIGVVAACAVVAGAGTGAAYGIARMDTGSAYSADDYGYEGGYSDGESQSYEYETPDDYTSDDYGSDPDYSGETTGQSDPDSSSSTTDDGSYGEDPTPPEVDTHPTLPQIDSYPDTADGETAAEALSAYLQAITDKDWSKVCEVNRIVDCGDLKAGDYKSTWDNVDIYDVTSQGSSSMSLRFTGRTHQPASLGPDGDSCTLWDLTYELTKQGSTWVITGSSSGSHEPC